VSTIQEKRKKEEDRRNHRTKI